MRPLDFWNPESFEISSYRYSLRDRINKTYTTSGSDDTHKCTYTYNELGFRGDSIKKEGFKIMSLGCSNTEGVGVNDNETWPSLFTNLIDNAVNLNFGTGGRSVDFVVRCLLTFYDYVNPDLVLIMYPKISRREIYTKDGGIEPFIPGTSWGYLKETNDGVKIQDCLTHKQNDYEDFVNWYKNHLLIKYFLETKKCNWVWNGCGILTTDFHESNRFDGNYNDYLDLSADGLHPGPKHNKTYALELYNFITHNFPSYIIN